MYQEIIEQLLDTGVLDRQMRVLVVCGGDADRDALQACGLRNVVISNLDTRMDGDEFAPFDWSFQDAEELSFDDDTFDFALCHWGLHHCYSPHRAVQEMYRVSRKGILFFEPCDNLLTRLGVTLHVGQRYEHAAVFYNDNAYGGVRNSPIPNYIYRWTEREVIKTISALAPYGEHRFEFFYRMRIPWTQLKGRKNNLFYYAVALARPLLKAFEVVFPRQSNNFAALVLKPNLPGDLHPWLRQDNGAVELDESWLDRRYGTLPEST